LDEKPLFYACSFGNKNVAKCLIENGADINHPNQFGKYHYLVHVEVEMVI